MSAKHELLNTTVIRQLAAGKRTSGLLIRDTIPALCDAVDALRAERDELREKLADVCCAECRAGVDFALRRSRPEADL